MALAKYFLFMSLFLIWYLQFDIDCKLLEKMRTEHA